jgi:hypothetical protein
MRSVTALSGLPLAVQRAVALALLAAGIALLWLVLIAPAEYAIRSQSLWRHDAAQRISEDRAWIGRAEEINQHRRQLIDSPIWNRFYAPGNDLPQRLRRDVNALVTASGANSLHFEALTVEPQQGLARAAMRVEISASIDQLKTLLTSMKSHKPYLRVEQLHVSAPQAQSSTSNSALNVSLDVFAYGAQLDPAIKVGL